MFCVSKQSATTKRLDFCGHGACSWATEAVVLQILPLLMVINESDNDSSRLALANECGQALLRLLADLLRLLADKFWFLRSSLLLSHSSRPRFERDRAGTELGQRARKPTSECRRSAAPAHRVSCGLNCAVTVSCARLWICTIQIGSPAPAMSSAGEHGSRRPEARI